jgi:Mycothiol-dependent nitroreductase Rv2466c
MATADLWADPSCPWTWITAQWLLEVERVRDVRADFHVMSLAVLNENRAPAANLAPLWGPVRVLVAADLSLGQAGTRPLYVSLAGLIHEERRSTYDRDFYAAALHRAGLPHTLANAADSPYYDDALRASHLAGVGPAGDDLGCPILQLRRADGEVVAFFGPVVTPRPRGEAAGRLWDSVVLAAETDGFFELKRARTRPPIFEAAPTA